MSKKSEPDKKTRSVEYSSLDAKSKSIQTLTKMKDRAVYIETSTIYPTIFHWAVRVGDHDWYEIDSKNKANSSRMKINGDLCGRARHRGRSAMSRLTLSGATSKTDREIYEFNKEWVSKCNTYYLLENNCQKYVLDLAQFLIGGSFELPSMPQAGVNAWADGPNTHSASGDGIAQAKATVGKAGAQWGIFGAEAEGPMASASAAASSDGSNFGAFTEASLGRAEAKVGPARVRIEPNVNTGIGLKDGQAQVKVLGFGISLGEKGLGVSTPLGGLGLGKF